jgi:pimeloyl-ACP methyl ester carboxylesterase
LNDLEIAYAVIGEGQPWVITPGGRYNKESDGIPEMARVLADRGQQAIIWDRPNCGASSVAFRGRSESEVQAEALAALIGLLPV